MNSSIFKSIASVLLATFICLSAQGQSQEPATTYSNGKVLIQQQRYELAMAELLPLTNSAPENQYAPEASYLYALAALKGNKLPEAYKMLLSLQNQHPNWAGMNDADYLLANVLFEQGDYHRAISKLQELAGTPLAADADGLKRYYLAKLNNRATFEQLLKQFPNDKAVGQGFADKLISGWYRSQDKSLLESIVSKFNLDKSKYLSKNILREQGFDVALLLPYQLNQAYQQTARKSQFITDFYAGVTMAQDSLKKQGININLFSYDTGADTTSVKRVFEMPELKQMDMVIGPVYKSTAKIAARFAAEQNINVINPFSQDLDMVKGNTNAFLLESSIATQAKQAATYAYQNFSPKTAIIVFEKAKDDTTFAYYYRQHFIKLGGKVRSFRKVNSALTKETAALFNGLNLQEIGHIAVFSDKMTAAVNTVSLLQGKAPKMPLVTYEKWLDINQISLKQLDNLEAYFISPKYIDKQSMANAWFREKYISTYNMVPSVYAYAGFEMMFYFGKMLHQYGPQFNQQLGYSGIQPGVFYQGIGYTDTTDKNAVKQDNQYVPITKLENLQLTVVNPVF